MVQPSTPVELKAPGPATQAPGRRRSAPSSTSAGSTAPAGVSPKGRDEYLRDLAKSVQVVLYVGDSSGTSYVSGAYEDVWGRKIEPLLAGRARMTDAVHADDRESVLAAQRQAASGEPAQVEYRVVRQDGEMRWIWDRLAPARDGSGGVYGFAGTALDVTERRRADEAFRAAKEEAERSNRAKSAFLSRMSHELRTPMNAVLGFAQLLEMDVQRTDDRECVDQILRAARHLLGLINEVLDITRLDSGGLASALEPVHLRTLLEEAFALVAPFALERGVTLPEKLPELTELLVRADRVRLKQVLLNLLSSAVKYNRDSERVTLGCAISPSGRLRVDVRDCLEGTFAERASETSSLTEGPASDEHEIEGTRIGLALSKSLMESMGGSIGAEFDLAGGAAFWFEIPLEEDQILKRAPSGGCLGPEWRDSALKPWRILHIEDNHANQHLVQRIFHGTGCEVIPAMRGQLGMELAMQHQLDLVLLDLDLPDVSGEEVLQRLRSGERTAHLPMVILSADARPAQIERLRAAGAREYLTKQVDVIRLLNVVDALLSNRPTP